jgi:hypothetical protein
MCGEVSISGVLNIILTMMQGIVCRLATLSVDGSAFRDKKIDTSSDSNICTVLCIYSHNKYFVRLGFVLLLLA